MKATRALRFVGLLLSLVLTACGTLPDVKPFADATATIHTGMRSVGDATIERVHDNITYLSVRAEQTNDAARASFEKSKRDQQNALAKLQKEFPPIVKAAGAFVDYADSLQGIVAAANSASDSATNFTTAVNKFATTLTGGAVISDAFSKAAARLYKEVATYQASRSLEAAMEQATPTINEVAEALKNAVKASKTNLFSEPALILDYAEVNNELKRKYGFDQSFRQEIVAEREKAFAAISKDCAKSCATPEKIENLKALDQLYERTQPFAVERAAGMQKVDEYFARQRALLGRIEAALDAWKDAHSNLLMAVKEKRQFNARQLVEVAQDIRDIIQEGKNNGK